MRTAGAAALVLSVGMQAWHRVAPGRPKVSDPRREAAGRIVPAVIEDIG